MTSKYLMWAAFILCENKDRLGFSALRILFLFLHKVAVGECGLLPAFALTFRPMLELKTNTISLRTSPLQYLSVLSLFSRFNACFFLDDQFHCEFE